MGNVLLGDIPFRKVHVTAGRDNASGGWRGARKEGMVDKTGGRVPVKVLVVGGGGREHALAWKISRSPLVKKLYCAPGNAGMEELGECVNITPEDVKTLVRFAVERKIDLTVVGPEAPLVAGLADEFQARGLAVFGPTAEAARMEGSKAFAKQLMLESGIPTAQAEVFDDLDAAMRCLRQKEPPYVIKADGLAAGKGVVVAQDDRQAYDALKACLVDKRFGASGDRVLVEEHLVGREASVLAFVDGEKVLPMQPAQDYKRVGEGDTGPNTGGMGSYSPVPFIGGEDFRRIVKEILEPTARALASRGILYRGVLYAGLMMTAEGPKVLEFNVRFGDPETQALLPRLKTDIVEVMMAVVEGRLEGISGLEWSDDPCVTVVLASGGYPGTYETGFPISGLDEASRVEGVTIFHAGTRRGSRGEVLTSGGRVLNVSAVGPDFGAARERAYEAVQCISFKNMYYRGDIAHSVAGSGGL
jgi:phosphoribosylamine--glycine ligase